MTAQLLDPDKLPASERAAYLDGQRRIAQSVRAALRQFEAGHRDYGIAILHDALAKAEAADAA